MSELEARREARRQKILQNSEKRLRKITSVEQKSDAHIEGFKYVPTNETEVASANSKTSFEVTNMSNGLDLPKCLIPSTSSKEVKTIYRNPNLTESISNVQVAVGRTEKDRQTMIVLLALIYCNLILLVNAFSSFSLGSLYLDKLFVPLLAYEFIDFIYGPEIVPGNFSILHLLSNRRFIKTYLKYVNCFIKLIQDVVLYFVTFIVYYSVFKLLI